LGDKNKALPRQRGLESDRAGLLLLLLRPGVDEAAVQRHEVLGGDALGVLA